MEAINLRFKDEDGDETIEIHQVGIDVVNGGYIVTTVDEDGEEEKSVFASHRELMSFLAEIL